MAAMNISGNYSYCSNTDTYHYVKKTGYLVKSPSSAGIGRWRRRWCKLVDQVKPAPRTGTPTRQVQLEYYTNRVTTESHKPSPKMKGAISLHSCIAVVSHEKKLKGYSYVLNIIMANITVHHLAASSEEERADWIRALNEFIFIKPRYSQGYFAKDRRFGESVYIDSIASYYKERLSKQTSPVDHFESRVSEGNYSGEYDNVSEEDGEIHAYDYIDDGTKYVLSKRSNDKEPSSDTDSDPGYWNDETFHPENRPHDPSLPSCSNSMLTKSKSFGDLGEESSKLYVLKLPQVSNATLNRRWSLSSTEDDGDNIPHRDNCPGKIFNRSSLTRSMSEIMIMPRSLSPEYDQCIIGERKVQMLSTASLLGKDTELNSCWIRRTCSQPLNSEGSPLPCNNPGQRGVSTLSHSYYNIQPEGVIKTEPPTNLPPTTAQCKTHEDAQGTASLEHSYYNLNGSANTLAERETRGKLLLTAAKHETLEDMHEPTKGTASYPYYDLQGPTNTRLEHSYHNMHRPTRTLTDREPPDMCKLEPHCYRTQGLSTTSAPAQPDGSMYCNPATLNPDGKMRTDGEYYNILEVCRSLPRNQEYTSSESPPRPRVRNASAPTGTEKKPMPSVRKNKVETNQLQSQDSSGPSTLFKKARQYEACIDVTSKPKSSPPVTPRRFKTTKEEEPNVDREKIKNQLTKMLSVSNAQQPVVQGAKSAPSTPKHKNSTTDNHCLQANKSKRVMTKSHSHEASRPATKSDAQVTKIPLLLPAKHKKLSGSLSFGGSSNPGISEGRRYMVATEGARRATVRSPTGEEASGYESPEYDYIDDQCPFT